MLEILIAVVAILLTLFVVVVIVPTNKDGKLNKFFQIVHNFFNFKKMYLSLALKIIYIFLTIFSILYGIRLLFGYSIYGYYVSTFWYGLAVIIASPILLRLSFEMLWLLISAAQSVIQIRDKMLEKESKSFDENFDDVLNATEKFSGKVFNKAKEFSKDALEAAGNKINEMKKANKQSEETIEKTNLDNTDNQSDDSQQK